MSIPKLIQAILNIQDLEKKVMTLEKENILLKNELSELKMNHSELSIQVEDLERECIDQEALDRAISELDLSDEVSSAIENLNISIKVN